MPLLELGHDGLSRLITTHDNSQQKKSFLTVCTLALMNPCTSLAGASQGHATLADLDRHRLQRAPLSARAGVVRTVRGGIIASMPKIILAYSA